ncbi:hypothetical protein I3843_03G117800 [Carya illinoinensis]|nr:hypothetical protein I3843_03G117800 [Carya illinoinensis]
MEYIGATGILVTFNHVPISNSFDFHFILSFAIDADPSNNAQNGKFSPYWADTLTPDSIVALKARHHPNVVPNVVKALATLFSWSLGKKVLRDSTFAFCIRELISMLKNENLISVRSPQGYYQAFRLRATQFDRDELLLSYEVNGREIQGDAFFEALDLLKKNGFDVNEIMIFSANASAFNNYYYERKSQYFLLNSTIYMKKNK